MATRTRPVPATTAVAATVLREPKRPTTGPDDGSAITAPAAMVSSSSPSWEGSRSSRSLTCGIRDAQLANAKPVAVNATYVARFAAPTSFLGIGTAGMMAVAEPGVSVGNFRDGWLG